MKIKDILIGALELGAVSVAALFAKTLYRAKQFKVSCDINVDALDAVSILRDRRVDYGKRPMNDFKVGAFLGILTCDMTSLEFNKRQYDMTVIVDQGVVTLILPEEVGIVLTSPQLFSNVLDDRVKIPNEPKSFIAVNADLRLGLLVLKNR